MSRKRKSEEASSTNDASSKLHKSETKAKPILSIGQAATLIRRGEIDKLKEIIEEGRILNINQSISRYSAQTLLAVACEADSLECVKLLVENNAIINYEDEAQNDLLESIIRGANLNILTYLLERGLITDDRCLLRCRSFIKMTGSNPMFSLLVDQITDVNFIFNHDSTFLLCTCSIGNAALAQILLQRGALRDWVGRHDYDALRSAAETGCTNVVTLLLNWNRTEAPIAADRVALALSAASYHDHLDVVRVLVEYGVGKDALNMALYEACEGTGGIDVVTYLLDQGADVNMRHDGMTPLVCVCSNECPDLAKLLLTRGADPNLAAPDELRPLDAADLHYEVMTVLLEHGADPNLPFDGDSTVLLEALRSDDMYDKAALLTVLLEHEADPNKADPDTGETPLMIAALAVEIDLVKLLLEHGADVTQVDRDGRAVLDMLGRTRKYGQVVELCEQYIECNKPGAKAILK